MQTKKTELEVDFIGDQVGLSTTEEQALSDYFKQQKLAREKSAKSSKTSQQQKFKRNPARTS